MRGLPRIFLVGRAVPSPQFASEINLTRGFGLLELPCVASEKADIPVRASCYV